MMKYVINHFNDDEDCYNNQQIIKFKDLFRGLIVKERIVNNGECVSFHTHNKILIKYCVNFYVECWKRRCVRLHSLEAQMQVLKEDAIALLEYDMKD